MANSGIQKIHKTLTQMQKNLECSICLELMQDPVLTKCEHHFCNFCILALLQSKRRPSAPCPLCKEPVTKRSLNTHSTLNGIVTAFRNIVAAVEDDTGQKCTPPRGPLRFSQPEPPSQRPKREEKKVPKKSNVRRGKAKSIPVIPIYLDDEEEETPGQSSEQRPTMKNNLNVVSSFSSPRKMKETAKKSNCCKGKENAQPSEIGNGQKITGESDILEVIANESLGQNGTKPSQAGVGDVESQSASRVAVSSPASNEIPFGKDPYEFIASQRTPRKVKKRKVKEKKKKPWEYSFGKISRKRKEGGGTDSERWAESQSDDDDEDSNYVHREDIENEEERVEVENERDDENKRKERSCRKGENRDGDEEGQEANEKQIEIIDSSDEEGMEEADRESDNEREERETDVKETGDHRGEGLRGGKRPRNAASKAMAAMKGQAVSQSSGEGSASADSGGCHGGQDADGIGKTKNDYGRSLIDFGSVHGGKNKVPVIGRTGKCSSPQKTKQSEVGLSASHEVNGHISQEFPLSQPPKLNRNHGDKLFAKAYGRGKTKSPDEKLVARPKKLKDDEDLQDVMSVDVDSDDDDDDDDDDDGKGNSQELFVEDVLDPTPPRDTERTVGGGSAADGYIEDEKEKKDEDEIDQQEAGADDEHMDEDALNGLLEETEDKEEGQFDDIEMEAKAADEVTHKLKVNESGNNISVDITCLNDGTSAVTEQTNEVQIKETLEVNNLESGNKSKKFEKQLNEGGSCENRTEDSAGSDKDEMVVGSGRKGKTLKDKMRNKEGLTPGETQDIARNDTKEHLQSDWELALKLAQEYGSVPPNLEKHHSRQVNNKSDVKRTGKRGGRKMKQLQIQNVLDTSDKGQHSRRTRRRNLRSNVAEECDEVDINSFHDDSRGYTSGEIQREVRTKQYNAKVKENFKNASLDPERETGSVQCVPETPLVVAKVTRGSLSSGKKKTKDKRKKEASVEAESEAVVVMGDREGNTGESPRAFEIQEEGSEVPQKQQERKGSSKGKGTDKPSERGMEEEETRPQERKMETDEESTKGGGRRRSSRLSKSQEEKIKWDKHKGSESERKVDSGAEIAKETTKNEDVEEGQGRQKSARVSKSQEKTESKERKSERESDVKEGEEAEGHLIVVADESDDEDVGDNHLQVKRASTRLLSKSQEKIEKEVVVVGGSAEKKGRRGRMGERMENHQAASVSGEEKQDATQDLPGEEDWRGGHGQKRRSLRKRKEESTQENQTEKRQASEPLDKDDKNLYDEDVQKENHLKGKEYDTVPSPPKGRNGKDITKETPQMDKMTDVGVESSFKSPGVERNTQVSLKGQQGLSGSTTESIELDSNPTIAQPDDDFTSEEGPQKVTAGREKQHREGTKGSPKNLSLTRYENIVDDDAVEEETEGRRALSSRKTRQSKRNSRDVKEKDESNKDVFGGREKRFSESQKQERLGQKKMRADKDGDTEKGGSLPLVDGENKISAEGMGDGTSGSVGLGKLRSRSSGRKGRENVKDGSSGLEEEEEEPIRRSSRRQKKDLRVKGQAEDGVDMSKVENNGESICKRVEIDQNKDVQLEAIQQGQKGETKAGNDKNVERMDKTEEGSATVMKGDPTSPDIFTMHLEGSELYKEGSIGRSDGRDEPSKGETGAGGEGDAGETPKTSKRKKKKRKTFSFGNEANLMKGSLSGGDAGVSAGKEVTEDVREVQKSESTTDADLELTGEQPGGVEEDSSHSQFVPATAGASESQSHVRDQIPIPRCLQRQREKSQDVVGSQAEMQKEEHTKEDLFTDEIVSVKRISSLKSRGKRQATNRKDDSEMSSKRFCSDSQFSLNSGEEESMVPPTPPVTTNCHTDEVDGVSQKEVVTDGEATTKKEETLVQAFEKIKRSEDKGSGSNEEVKVPSSLSTPSISLFEDVEIPAEREAAKDSGKEIAKPSNCSISPGSMNSSETGRGGPQRELEGDKSSKKDDASHGSSPEDLPNVLGDNAEYCQGIQENLVASEMSKNDVGDLDKDVQEDTEEKDKFVQPHDKQFDEEEPLFDDEYPVSPASSIGRHNLTSASSVLSSQSDLMTSQQQERAKKVLENMEKEIAEMEKALAEEAEEGEEIELVDEKDNIISDEDEEETDKNETREVTRGKEKRRDDVINTSQEAKDHENDADGPLEGMESISLSSDEDEGEALKKQVVDGEKEERRRERRDRHTSGHGRKIMKKYSKYKNLNDIDDDDIAQNVKENLTEMAEAEKSLDSLLKAHAARREEENDEMEEEEAEKSGDEEIEVHRDGPSTPSVTAPTSPPRSPSPAPLLSQRTLARRLSPLQKNIQKAEEIVKNYSEERPVASQKRRRVVIEDSDSESEEEVQYRSKKRKSLKLDSPESCDADEGKVKGQPDGKRDSLCKVRTPTQKTTKESSPKTTSDSRDSKVLESNPKNSPKGGGMQHNSPDRKKVTTPQTSSSASGGSISKKKPRKGELMSLVATGLNKQKLRMVDQLCKKAGCKFSSVFMATTTHVIVNAGDNLTCERTLKYFQGIAARRWVISFQWVQDSLSASRLLPLEKYEIRGDSVNGQNHCGPRRARLWKGPPLLGDYNLFCLEPYTGLNKAQLEGLLKACGGSVYQHPSEMPQEDGKENFIIAQHDVEEEAADRDYQAMYEKYQAKVISREWVLDSIAVYTTQPITDYLLCDVTECDDIDDLISDDEF